MFSSQAERSFQCRQQEGGSGAAACEARNAATLHRASLQLLHLQFPQMFVELHAECSAEEAVEKTHRLTEDLFSAAGKDSLAEICARYSTKVVNVLEDSPGPGRLLPYVV